MLIYTYRGSDNNCKIFSGHDFVLTYRYTLIVFYSKYVLAIYITVDVLLPGQRSLIGCSPWGCEESDTTEWLHFHFSLFMHWRRKWQPTPVFLPGESQGQQSGGLPSMESHRFGLDWSDLAAAAADVPHGFNIKISS